MREQHVVEPDLASQIAEIQSRIQATCLRSGRNPSEITVIAVTKTHPLEYARKACALGIKQIGENRVQEPIEKFGDMGIIREYPDCQLHLIGHLQRNKVRKAMQIFDSVDSVDTIELAEDLSSEAANTGKSPRILLEVNTSKELQKSGVGPVETIPYVEKLLSFPGLRLAGLMTVGPLTDREYAIRDSFRLLKQLFEDVKARLNPPGWSALSMGMSGDYEIAIEEGATEIRLGTALFGQRSATT